MSNISALSVARYLIDLAAKSDENDLTNLKLQKLLYFAQGEHLLQFGRPLFCDDIEAWKLGPVVRAVYSEYKKCGAFPITVFDGLIASTTRDKLPEPIKAFLKNRVWNEYGKYSASYLVTLAHKPGGPWRRFFQEEGNGVIPLEALRAVGEEGSSKQI
jgi:uncharacterized phage-associated protein